MLNIQYNQSCMDFRWEALWLLKPYFLSVLLKLTTRPTEQLYTNFNKTVICFDYSPGVCSTSDGTIDYFSKVIMTVHSSLEMLVIDRIWTNKKIFRSAKLRAFIEQLYQHPILQTKFAQAEISLYRSSTPISKTMNLICSFQSTFFIEKSGTLKQQDLWDFSGLVRAAVLCLYTSLFRPIRYAWCQKLCW